MLLFGDKIAAEGFVGGINAGLSLTSYTEPPTSTGRLDWSFGAFLEWEISDHWYFGADITFKTPAGANNLIGLWDDVLEVDTLISDSKESQRLSYVSVPLLMKYRFDSFGFIAGPQVGYLVAATDNIRGTGPNGARLDAERLAFNKLNRWDVGAVIGVEYLLNRDLGMYSMRFGLRYYQGFLDVTQDPSTTVLNSGFYFTVGIPIGGPTVPQPESES